MEISLPLLLTGLPAAFILGWIASRLDMRQLRMENRQAPKAYFKGLNYLLNEQQDQAIDAFIEAVQIDPDTSELHFALGNLFRRRGEYERAIRVHQHLLSRADLSTHDRERAQHALALDFLKAGLLDRAEAALLKLENTASESQAWQALLSIYERSRDWVHAAEIAQKMQAHGLGSFTIRQAHYLCEQAAYQSAQQPEQATKLLQQAIQIAPDAPRPRLELARLQQANGHNEQAFETLKLALLHTPAAAPLIAPLFAQLAIRCQQTQTAYTQLTQQYQHAPSLDVLDAIVTLDCASGLSSISPREWYAHHLEKEPSLIAATQWIADEKLEHEQFHPYVQKALEHAVKPLKRYRCAACGFEAKQHFWQCPGCQTWDSYPARRVEEL
jgi:lipopolysaccharide biosynthesis regulator YciM